MNIVQWNKYSVKSIRFVRIKMSKLLSMLNKFSCNLNFFLNYFNVNATHILRRFIIYYSFHDCFYFKKNSFLNLLFLSMYELNIMSCCFEHSLSNHVRFRSFNVESTRRRVKSRTFSLIQRWINETTSTFARCRQFSLDFIALCFYHRVVCVFMQSHSFFDR
jgi:hypothetical protein